MLPIPSPFTAEDRNLKMFLPAGVIANLTSLRSPIAVANLEVEPFAKPGIVNLRFSAPELRRQAALNLQMIQLQLNNANSLGKISAHIP